MKFSKFSKLFFVFSILFTSSLVAYEKDKIYNITILHTNDHHGRFWNNEKDEYGLAAQKTVVDRVRKEVADNNGTILLLSGGDINTGVPESDLMDAEPDFLGMDKIGYDAMAIGNHEFDNPLETLKAQQALVSFPFLSANTYEKTSGKRAFPAYAIFNKNGVKIAVIGLTTEDTAKMVDPDNIKTLEFKDPKIEAQIVIDELKTDEKPDIIIAATHMGHYDDGNHGTNAPGDVELARAVKSGDLQMIVGGHSQDPLCMQSENVRDKNYIPGTPCAPDNQNGTWIVQAHEWGKYVGRADFEFKNGDFKLISYELIPVNLKKEVKSKDGNTTLVYYTQEIPKDQEMLELLTPYQELGQSMLNVKVGQTQVNLNGDRSVVRSNQTNLGKLIIKAHMQRTNSDFGIMNSGGIRDSIAAGDITYRDILKVHPFGNIVSYAELSGDDLVAYLTNVAGKTKGTGGYAQWSNISFTQNEDGSLSNIKIDGKPLDMNKIYRFSVPDFNAKGGDGYPVLQNFVTTGFTDHEILKDYISKNSPLTEDNLK